MRPVTHFTPVIEGIGRLYIPILLDAYVIFSLFEFAVQRPFGNIISLNEPPVYKRQTKFLNI